MNASHIPSAIRSVLVTGGGGYVGSNLVPKLIRAGYAVTVYDLFIYGQEVLDEVKGSPLLKLVKADIRDAETFEKSLAGVDAVIHLACISNDPSYELNPDLGKSINFDAFAPMVEASKRAGVKRFIYASSSSVYGVKDEPEVTEDLELEPLTDYSKFKAQCEQVLLDLVQEEMTVLIVRPATVCGYAPRLRLDLAVNILTNHAINKREITVFGGGQKRPNIHIEDMTDFYLAALKWPHEKIHRKTYNVGYENFTVQEIAEMVQRVVGKDIPIKAVPTNDNRSYHVSSAKIARELGFEPRHTIVEAVEDLARAFEEGKIPDSMSRSNYFNIKRMQEVSLS